VGQTLRSYANWATSVRNFEWLMDSVSGAMDVDCLIERRGHFLVVEGKPWNNGVNLPYGQHRALYALSQQPRTRVYLVGEKPKDDVLHVACVNTSPKPVFVRGTNQVWWKPETFTPTTRELFVLMVRAWWEDCDESV